MKRLKSGFTLIEILVVVAILAILATTVAYFVGIGPLRQALFGRAKVELRNIAQATLLSVQDYGDYPPDADRDLPPGVEKYLSGHEWPKAPWTGSVYDWDNWVDPDTGRPIYQISIRFCPYGQPNLCEFPKEEWAKDFDYYSSVYYCIEGACRSHISQPVNHPGLCVNCPQ